MQIVAYKVRSRLTDRQHWFNANALSKTVRSIGPKILKIILFSLFLLNLVYVVDVSYTLQICIKYKNHINGWHDHFSDNIYISEKIVKTKFSPKFKF